jgi:poly-gamma-glutamate capsule biosynthesis protein CapA/YwtB (metallophosphatase superfamily)
VTGTGRWRFAAGMGLLLGVLASGMACVAGSHGAPQTPAGSYPREVAQVNFAVAGDVIPHEAVRAAASAAGPGEQGWAALLGDVADVFHRADFGFVNMETPVAPTHSHGTKPFMFDAPVDLILALKSIGIKVVSFANNHVFDQGQAGFAETREHLRESGMLFAGSGDSAPAAWQPVIVEKSGIKVGILGMTRWLNGNRNPGDEAQPHVNFFPYPEDSGGAVGYSADQVLDAVKQARAKCDFLVISIHWGVEYMPAPRDVDVAMAHKMLDAGATVIVGHHPHVLQPVQTYRTADGRDGLIFFSLGNFLSNQSRDYREGSMPEKEGDPRDSMIGLFSAVQKDYGPAGTKVELGNVGILPVWGENNHNELAAGKAKKPVIGPILIDREIPRLEARLVALDKANIPATSWTAAQKTEFADATGRLKLMQDRRAQIVARTNSKFIAEAPALPVGH